MIDENSSITSFSFRQCGLDDDLFRLSLVRNISVPLNPRLVHLDLSHNALTEKGIRHLASILGRLPRLKSLTLDGLRLSCNSIRALAHALRKHPNVQHLSFVGCGLSDECMELLSLLIKSNSRIKALDLSENKFTVSGLAMLTDIFRAGAGKSIESLNISYNMLGDLGALSLARVLEISQLHE